MYLRRIAVEDAIQYRLQVERRVENGIVVHWLCNLLSKEVIGLLSDIAVMVSIALHVVGSRDKVRYESVGSSFRFGFQDRSGVCRWFVPAFGNIVVSTVAPV